MPIGSGIPHCTLPILHKHHIHIHSMPGQEHNDLCMCVGMGDGDTQMYRIIHNTVCALFFAEFIFRGFAISAFFAILNSFAVAGYRSVEIFTGEIFADIQSEPIYQNSIRQLQRCKTCWTCCWIGLKMSSYRMESCIREFHIYKEVWTPLIGAWLCPQKKQQRRSVRYCNEERH